MCPYTKHSILREIIYILGRRKLTSDGPHKSVQFLWKFVVKFTLSVFKTIVHIFYKGGGVIYGELESWRGRNPQSKVLDFSLHFKDQILVYFTARQTHSANEISVLSYVKKKKINVVDLSNSDPSAFPSKK